MPHAHAHSPNPILDRVAIHAAETASLSLSKWLGRNVKIHTNGFASASLCEASSLIGGGDRPVVAVHTQMEGAISGHVLLAFPEEVASQLVAILTSEPIKQAADFDDLSKSALSETGNIVSSTFLNGLSTALGVRSQPSAPTYTHDLGAALIQPLVAEQLENSADILYLQASFEVDGVSLEWWLYIVPGTDSMQVMTALLQ